MEQVRPALAVFLVLVAAAGCGSSAARLTAKQLPTLVLQPGDLPADFQRFDEGRQVSLDRVPGPRYETARFGREDGWKARYRRAGTSATSGPLVVESRADVFASPSGAQDDLAAYRYQFEHAVAATLIQAPSLGDGAVAMTQLQPGTPGIRYYSIAWRNSNATGSVTANGFAGRLTFAQAVALARAQERRMARGIS
jgi:hypothetical protein